MIDLYFLFKCLTTGRKMDVSNVSEKPIWKYFKLYLSEVAPEVPDQLLNDFKFFI